MKKMEDKILAEGKILPGGVLKVGSFLNQQIDTVFMEEIGKEIAGLFKVTEPVHDVRDECGGLTAPGRCRNKERAAAVRNDLLLFFTEWHADPPF